jgi:hypothetical protein
MRNQFSRVVKRQALVLLAAAAAAASTVSNAQVAEVRVIVKSDQYLLRAFAFDSLDAFEEAVRASRPPVVQLDACGHEAARALKAATHRLSDRVLRIQVLNETALACRSGVLAMPAIQRPAPALSDIDDAAVERYWQQTSP